MEKNNIKAKLIVKGSLVLIVFLIIGAVSGYWSLIKQVNNIK